MKWLTALASKTAALGTVTGVHLFLNREGQRQVEYLTLQKKKQKVVIVQQGQCSWQEFLKQYTHKIPIALSVDGKGILTKEVSGTGEIALEEVLPGASEEEFFYNALSGVTHSWITLARKQVVEEILSDMKQVGISLTQLHMGPLSTTTLLGLLPNSLEVQLPQWHIQQQEGQLLTISPSSVPTTAIYQIGEDSLPAARLQPYANALSALIKLQGYASSNLSGLQEEWLHERLYKRLSVGVLAFFFTLLLLNYGLFTYLSSKQQELSLRVQQHQHLLSDLKLLQAQETARQQLLQAIPLQQQTLFAYHADLLAATVPAGVQLEEVAIHPQEGKKSKKQSLQFQHGRIEVKGQCSNPLILNQWLEHLEQQHWVAALVNQRYTSGSLAQGGSTFGFTLKVAAP